MDPPSCEETFCRQNFSQTHTSEPAGRLSKFCWECLISDQSILLRSTKRTWTEPLVVYLSEKFWLTRDFTSARPGPSSAPQGSQSEMQHFLASVGAATWYCTAMLWSIDSCQIRVSADQYHLTVSRVQVSPIEVTCFLKFSRDKLLIFSWSQAQLQVDFFAIVTSLSLFEVNYKFFIVSFAFSPS